MPVIGVWDDHDYGINDGNKVQYTCSCSLQEFLPLSSHALIKMQQ